MLTGSDHGTRKSFGSVAQSTTTYSQYLSRTFAAVGHSLSVSWTCPRPARPFTFDHNLVAVSAMASRS